jgi:hypothetical protein
MSFTGKGVKHAGSRVHYFKEAIWVGGWGGGACPTDDLLADLLTKPLMGDKFALHDERARGGVKWADRPRLPKQPNSVFDEGLEFYFWSVDGRLAMHISPTRSLEGHVSSHVDIDIPNSECGVRPAEVLTVQGNLCLPRAGRLVPGQGIHFSVWPGYFGLRRRICMHSNKRKDHGGGRTDDGVKIPHS